MAQGWCEEKDISYFEVSAKNDINVAQAFEVLARQALSRVSVWRWHQFVPLLGWRILGAFREDHTGTGWHRGAHDLSELVTE